MILEKQNRGIQNRMLNERPYQKFVKAVYSAGNYAALVDMHKIRCLATRVGKIIGTSLNVLNLSSFSADRILGAHIFRP